MFKAQRKDGKGEVRGWLVKIDSRYALLPTYSFEEACGKSLMETFRYYEIIPSTLSMQTGQTDKNGEMIYGSFELDGKMTEGGDRVLSRDNGDTGKVEYSNIFTSFVIINENHENLEYGIGQYYDLEIIKGK